MTVLLLVLGAIGWGVAGALAVRLYRRRRAEALAVAPSPPTAPDLGRFIAHLYAADGSLESQRQMRGTPPAMIYRPHGREPATRYRLRRCNRHIAEYEVE